MGVSRSPLQLVGKLGRLADDYQDLPLALVKEGSLIVKKAVIRRAPARLRGVGKKGAKLGVRYNVAGAGVDAKSLIFATGPFQLIERNTKAHRIPKQRGARARRRVAVIPGVGVRAYAMHPGTKGKHPWAKGLIDAEPDVARLMERRSELVLRRIF